MVRRLTAAIHRGLHPRTTAVFGPGRKASWVAVICGAFLAHAAAAEDLVFEGGGTRLALPASDAQAIFMHGKPSVQFALGEEARQAFADLTGGMIGETLTVSLCGIELVQAVVRERLWGNGIVNLPDIEGALAVADVMRGESGCDAITPHFPD